MNNLNIYIGETKYFPSESKEWNNNIYYYNNNYIKNLPVYDLNINKLIKNYFNLYLNHNHIKSKYISPKKKLLSLNKIFVSKAEINHTSSKATITVYVYNREKIVLLRRFENLSKSLYKLVTLFFKYKNLYLDFYNKHLKKKLRNEILYLKKNKLRLNINNLKFKDILLYKLSKLIAKFYSKKVEFNVVNLKSIAYSASIFTEITRKRLINRNSQILKLMGYILSKGIVLEENNNLEERMKIIKSVDLNILENKYQNLNVNYIVKNVNLNETIKDMYNTENQDNKDIIFNNIKYKTLGGIRLEAKGRLTKRYRADRAVFKVKLKGGLKNIDSSYRGLSTVNYRGNIKSNLEYSMGVSKRRVGSFAVKGWIAGK